MKQSLALPTVGDPRRGTICHMKMTLLALTLFGFTTGAFGQSVYLKVVPLESIRESKPNEQLKVFSSTGGAFSKKIECEEAFNVTVRNMLPIGDEYTVEWMFMASPAGGGKVKSFHAGEKKVALEKNGSTTFEINSPKLESTHTRFGLGSQQDTFTGLKFAGYVVRVRIDEKILAVESTDALLKRKYTDPKAKWGVEAKPATTKPNATALAGGTAHRKR